MQVKRIVECSKGSLNAGQKYCRMLQGEHSAILSAFIKLLFVKKIFVLSIFEWPFYTGFTVECYKFLYSISKCVLPGSITITDAQRTGPRERDTKHRQSQHNKSKATSSSSARWTLKYTQLQKKPISHFSWQLWKSELRNENIFIPYSVAISPASIH